MPMHSPQRVVLFRPRTVLQVVGVLLGVAVALWVVWVSIRVLTWVFVALFLALALEPGVRFLQEHGMKRRGAAAAVIYLAAIGFLALLAALLVPPLVDEVDGLADAAPGYVEDITAGRGPLGFLADATTRSSTASARRRSPAAARCSAAAPGRSLDIGRGVLTGIVGFITIVFLTLFMILEGPTWVERGLGLMPPASRPRWRNVGHRIAADRLGLRDRQPAALGDRRRLLDDRGC